MDAHLGSGAMFDGIAPRYDLLNRLMSLGTDRLWRRRLVEVLAPESGQRILDLATGTGDVALEVLRQQPQAKVIGLDPSRAMLLIGRAKVARRKWGGAIQLLEGDAQRIPFPDRSFDGVTMAFGIRNVLDRPAALAEMVRVTRPGGRVCVLELGEPPENWKGRMARFHVHRVVPRMGALLSSGREYLYLQDSIARFPAPGEFVKQMAAAGLAVDAPLALSFGSVHLFTGRVPQGAVA